MESNVSQKLFNLNIQFLGGLNPQGQDDTILELVHETSVEETVEDNKPEILPAADILEFSYPPESPFYNNKKSAQG